MPILYGSTYGSNFSLANLKEVGLGRTFLQWRKPKKGSKWVFDCTVNNSADHLNIISWLDRFREPTGNGRKSRRMPFAKVAQNLPSRNAFIEGAVGVEREGTGQGGVGGLGGGEGGLEKKHHFGRYR